MPHQKALLADKKCCEDDIKGCALVQLPPPHRRVMLSSHIHAVLREGDNSPDCCRKQMEM